MKINYKEKLRRVLAVIMIMVIVLSNSATNAKGSNTDLAIKEESKLVSIKTGSTETGSTETGSTETGSTESENKEEQFTDYTVTVLLGGKVELDASYITSVQEKTEKTEKKKIDKNNDKYKLNENSKYTCTLKGEGINEHDVDLKLDKNNKKATATVNNDFIKIGFLDEVWEDEDINPENFKFKIKDSNMIEKNTWLLDSEDSDIATIEKGILKTKKIAEGENTKDTITITRKINIEQNIEQNNKSVLVLEIKKTITLKNKTKIEIKYGIGENYCDEQSISIMENGKEKELKKVDKKYLLKPNTTYKCVISNKLGFDNKTIEFKIPENETTKTIDITDALIRPQIKIAGKKIIGSQDINIKSNTIVPCMCTNYKNLYAGNWKIKIGEKQYEFTGEKFDITTPNTNISNSQISYILNGSPVNISNDSSNNTKDIITVFDSYNFKYKFLGTEVAEKTIITEIISDTEDKGNNTIKKDNLKHGKTYKIDTLNIKGLKISSEGLPNVTIDCFKQYYDIEIPQNQVEMVVPTIKFKEKITESEIEEYYGTKIGLIVSNENALYQPDKWSWEILKQSKDGSKWIAQDDMNVEMVDKGPSLGLTGDVGNQYKIVYQFKVKNTVKSKSNELKVTPKQIDLIIPSKFSWSDGKEYDTTPYFYKTVNVNDLIPQNSKINIEENLILKGEVENADVGNYTTIKIVDFEVEGDDSDKNKRKKYNFENIKNKEIKDNDPNKELFEIKQRTVTGIDIVRIPIIYHLYIVDVKRFGIFYQAEKLEENLEENLKLAIIEKLNIIYDNETISFSGLSETELNGNEITTKNFILKFHSKLREYENRFAGGYIIPQTITSDINVSALVEFKQDKTTRKPDQWINNKNITATMIDESYAKDYPLIKFIEISDGVINDNENGLFLDGYMNDFSTESTTESTNNIDLSSTDSKKNRYFKMVFLKDEEGSFFTTAAVIRIIGEDSKNNQMINVIKDRTDVEFNVYNFKLDTSGDVIDLKESDKNELKEFVYNGSLKDIQFSEKSIYKKQGEYIDIEVNKNGSSNKSLQYIIKSPGSDLSKDEKWMNSENYTKDENTGKITGKIELPDKDGSYIVYVKALNEADVEAVYVSDIIVVDNTLPEISMIFSNENNSEKTTKYKEILEENRIYFKTSNNKLSIEEANISEIKVSIIGKNVDGEEIVNKTEQWSQEGTQNNDVFLKENIEINENGIIAPLILTEDANYKVVIWTKDKAGNESSREYNFTKDAISPETGSIHIKGYIENVEKKDGVFQSIKTFFEKTWNKYIVNTFVDVFAKDKLSIELSAKDKLSTVDIYYHIANRALSEEELKSSEIDWTKYSGIFKTKLNEKEFVYMKAEDQSKNISYFNTDGIITDTEKPDIDISPKENPNENNFYNKNVKLNLKIEDKLNASKNLSSGLKHVEYTIKNNGEIVDTVVLLNENNKFTENLEKELEIDAKKINGNDIKVDVTAIDNSGNISKNSLNLCIDVKRPKIEINYNYEENSTYSNKTKIATINIKERNLDTKDVTITIQSKDGKKAKIGKWSHTENKDNPDDSTHTCQVTFDADDDYEFFVNCQDQAGNQAVNSYKDKFTIDKTNPVIEVNYNGHQIENEGYYNQRIDANITVNEHNFNSDKVNIRVFSEGDDARTVTSKFTSRGDTHNANVSFDRDGIYRLEVSYTDEAGNSAGTYSGDKFTIDLKNPEINISNVEDKSANKDEVRPIIVCTDENYDKESVFITVTGANNGKINLDKLKLSRSQAKNGERFEMSFPKSENMDDIYTLAIRMLDKAGNELEKSIQFSVNRYGSVYTIGSSTGEWLKNGICSYLKEERPVIIVETNVNEVKERNISCTKGSINAETSAIKEWGKCSEQEKKNGTYYKIKETNASNSWCQYQYEIAANNFEKEGNYSIQIDSVDQAGNHTNNISNKHASNQLNILFTIDQTAPTAVVSGTEDGQMYKEDKHTVMLDVQDNSALKSVSVYLNDKEYKTYNTEDLAELKGELIPVEVKEAFSTQTIQLKAMDMAGNVLGEDVEGNYDKKFEDFHVVVTQNIFAQIAHSYWYILLIIASLIIGMVGFIVYLLKRKNK